ncbi:unnamed protein product [Gadus morhua 'NCC']
MRCRASGLGGSPLPWCGEALYSAAVSPLGSERRSFRSPRALDEPTFVGIDRSERSERIPMFSRSVGPPGNAPLRAPTPPAALQLHSSLLRYKNNSRKSSVSQNPVKYFSRGGAVTRHYPGHDASPKR